MPMLDTNILSTAHHNGSLLSLDSLTSWGSEETKAIFLDTSIPVTYHKHHIRISSSSNDFSTIIREDERATVREIRELLSRKFHLGDVTLMLRDDKDNDTTLRDDVLIVELQNELFREMWVEEKDLPKAVLKYETHFRFVIC